MSENYKLTTMKELTIEQKAKAYDEAKARMSKAYNSNRCTIGFMNEIFPEFKDEDERIKEEIINYFKCQSRDEPCRKSIHDKGVKDGLEKQGQTFTKKDIDDAWLKGMCDAKHELEKQCGQNPTWSEEDEVGLGDALWAIEQAKTIAKNENDMGNLWYAETWLKSLRLQKQWKPSEKQMEALKESCDEHWEPDGLDPLYTLYQELKKLREE